MNLELAKNAGIIPESHSRVAVNSTKGFRSRWDQMVKNKQLLEEGMNEAEIKLILAEIALSDSNNFSGKVGVGEREGRVFSRLVADRHFELSHGIGRSGNIRDPQPKAAGSSVLARLTDALLLDAIKVAGVKVMKAALVLPMATGMALRECFIALRHERPKAQHVIWPRIDQKSCLKSMVSIGLTVHVIEPIEKNNALETNVEAIREKIDELGCDNVLAVHSTISCFAPRQPDLIPRVSELCFEFAIPHIINGAYCLQIPRAVNLINASVGKKQRLDCVVFSTDKNFMTPVGGSVILTPTKGQLSLATKVATNYPGRASMSPILDLFITLLEMGKSGYRVLLAKQKANFKFLLDELEQLAAANGCSVLTSNGISIAFSVENLKSKDNDYVDIGSMLFTRNVSGPRIVNCDGVKKVVGAVELVNFGANGVSYSHPYIALACAIGMERHEITQLISKLTAVLDEFGSKSPEKRGTLSN